MSIPTKLLLEITQPGWDPAKFLKQNPPATWFARWKSLVLMVDALENTAGLSRWPKKSIDALLAQLEIWRVTTGAKRPLTLAQVNRQARWLTQSAAFRLSDSLCGRLSGPKKRVWLEKCIRDAKLLEKSRDAYWFDECLDRVLGLQERKVKQSIRERGTLSGKYSQEEIYFETDPEDLYTPYRVLVQIFRQFKPNQSGTFLDLGSGLGRVGLVAGILRPRFSFLGYEIVHERTAGAVRAAKDLKLRKVHFYNRDVSRHGLPVADCYFLFNPFHLSTLQHVTRQLRRLGADKSYIVITPTIGLPWSHLNRAPWLKKVWFIKRDPKWDDIGVAAYRSVTNSPKTGS